MSGLVVALATLAAAAPGWFFDDFSQPDVAALQADGWTVRSAAGHPGIAGAAFVVLAATLAAGGTIPVASVALVLGVHRLMSQALTSTNLLGNAVATIVIAKWENALDHRRLNEALDGGRSYVD